LSKPEKLPVEAIRAALADRATMVPIFQEAIDGFVSMEGPIDRDVLFFAFHLLGEWREKSAYRTLASFLRLPREVLDVILGDCITETSHRVMAAVFDGDPDPLYEIIRDEEADEFVRAHMCHVIAMVTRRGELPLRAASDFLRDCYARLAPSTECYVWQGWSDAVAWLGLAELKPLVQQAYQRGLIDPSWQRFEHFEQDLQYTVEHHEADPLYSGNLTLFGDTIVEMSNWTFTPKRQNSQKPEPRSLISFGMPHREPLRKVGRNDPCPCGSGKKFKKCCLNADPSEFFAGDPFGEAVGLNLRRH
jgi:hypothetical protein